MRSKAIYFATLAVFSSCIVLFAQNSITSREDLEAAFLRLGFSEFYLDEYDISFSRELEPSEGNGRVHKLRWIIDLDTIEVFSDLKIERFQINENVDFVLFARFERLSSEDFRILQNFKDWVRREYPQENWPYNDAQTYTELTSTLEQEFTKQVPIFPHLNRRIAYSDIGSVTTPLDRGMAIAARNLTDLENLKLAIKEFGISSNCEIDR